MTAGCALARVADKEISVIQIICGEDGSPQLGPLTMLPLQNVEVCGPGFNWDMVLITSNGVPYYAFRDDLADLLEKAATA